MSNSPRRRALALLLLALPLSRPASAQAPAAAPAAPISDNSFLVEEAYNQESGVVQHIGTYRRARGGFWLATFTQEWPAPSQRDKLSYTLPLATSAGGGSALGDVAINYRRQVLGADDEPIWFSPRLSVIRPTGDEDEGTGLGGPGVQVNLPLSVRLTEQLVTHWNAGATLSRARAVAGVRDTRRNFNASASAIWLLAPTFNLMLEGAWDRVEALDGMGGLESSNSFVLLPGARAAINLPSGMQIVPGIGVPIGVGPSRGERDVFVYLSVEHSFR
jgi:hypothetical protein